MIEQILDLVFLKLIPIGIISIGLPVGLIYFGYLMGRGLRKLFSH